MVHPHLQRLPAAISVIAVAALLATGGCASAQAQTDPDLNIAGQPHFETLTLSSGFTNDPRVVELRAGGDESARGLGSGCVGNIASRPDVRVHYDAGSIFPLNIYAVSDETDLTLVINRPDGSWICNDDYSGLNPAVLMENPMSGQYDIWVGVYSGDLADATLYISELEPDFSDPPGFGDDFADLDIDGEPYFGTLELSSGFSNDPRTVNVRAGGSQSASELGPGCAGNIGTRPDVRLHYDAGSVFPLNIYATSSDDLTLVILDPDGEWLCNDDYDGLDPAVLIDDPLSGRYDIWVGVWGGGTAEGRLFISELTPRFDR